MQTFFCFDAAPPPQQQQQVALPAEGLNNKVTTT
jgi:hypothetical protein